MNKKIVWTIVFESIAILSAILSIFYSNRFSEMWSYPLDLSIKYLILKYICTFIFGISVGMLTISNNCGLKKGCFIDIAVRVLLTTVF